MWEYATWLYLLNATLLINHEIDSAYWKEWDLFRIPGGISLFLAIHLPAVLLLLWGLLAVADHSKAGLIVSLVLAGIGGFAFSIHMYFLKKGRPEFRTFMSLAILIGTLVVSLIQGVVCLKLLAEV